MPHPLGRDLTRAAEAAGALRALMLAEGDDRLPDTDRAAIATVRATLRHALACVPWRSRTLARTAGALAGALDTQYETKPEDDHA